MKFRVAKKIIFSSHWHSKIEKIDRYKPYINKRDNWTYPSLYTYPMITKAMRIYRKHKVRNKRRVNSI